MCILFKEAKILTKAVRREAIQKRIGGIEEKQEELRSQLRQIGLRDNERLELQEQYDHRRRIIRQIKKLEDAVLFSDREEEYDWMKIAAQDFSMMHSPDDCCLYWRNFAHPSINTTAWTKVEKNFSHSNADKS